MLNILILLLVAFELSLFSLFIVPPALSSSLSSQVFFFTVRFTSLLVLLLLSHLLPCPLTLQLSIISLRVREGMTLLPLNLKCTANICA